MRWIRRSLAAKVLVGGLVLVMVVIVTISGTFLTNREREARAAATGMADSRAAFAVHLLPQTTGVESAAALSRIAGDSALTAILGASPPQTASVALDLDSEAASAPTAIVIVDVGGGVVFSHIPATWSGLTPAWGELPSVRAALLGRQVHGIDVLGTVPAYAVTMPLLRGGDVVGAVAALTPVSSQIQRFAATAGYPVVLVTASAPTRMLRAATSAGVVEGATPTGLVTSIAGGGAIARVTEGFGGSADDRAISVVPIPGMTGTAPVAYLGVEVPLQQFTGDASSQVGVVASVALIALAVLLVTTLALILFVNLVVRRPLARLERAVARISAGDYSANIPITSSDELGRLAASVNRMRQKIADTVQTMDIQANTDSHTGLFNFRFLVDHLVRESSSAVRHGTPVALLMVDIDNFKLVNDRYGHPGGDRALASIATTIANSVRETDVAARYGGEEFAIVMPHTDHRQALVVAEKIRAAVAATSIDLGIGEHCQLTVSVGAASFPQDCATPDTLIALADAALYGAKHSGRNCVGAADSLPPPTRAAEKMEAGVANAPSADAEPVSDLLAKV